MKTKLLMAIISASIVTGTGFGLGKAVDYIPKGKARDMARQCVLEPGRALAEKLGDSRAVKKARRDAAKQLENAAGKLKDAGVSDADRWAERYTEGAWAGLGFAVCLALALMLGVSSIGSALALGVKVSLAFIFLQGAAVLGLIALLHR
ncbi:MAG: hypothetical protein KGL53_14950 [Elusimicrobia bacterium]|nr:hypothetical protein [Elusimicrobiota bacterium]